MYILGDIGNTDTKIFLVSKRNKVLKRITFISKKISNNQLKILFKKKMEKTGLLSFLFFENGTITIDEITPKDKYGLLFNNQTKRTSASVGKSITSYVTGHAVCEGYIDNLDVKLSDWPGL